MPVAVVSDTTAYLSPELVERHSIGLVPLYIVFGDRTERESDITDYPAYFDELRGAEKLPTTSQPSVGDFIDVYGPRLDRGDDIVSIHIAGGLSGTAEAARQAAAQLERDGRGGERVRVVDSHTVAGGLALCVLGAAQAADAGADAEAVVRAAEQTRSDLKLWFAIDTLEFLKRGGRIGAASAWIGSTLRVKPILTVEDELTPIERVRTRSRMFERLVDYAKQRHESEADAWVVQHISAPEEAAQLVERCSEVFGCDPIFVTEIGPVVSTHAGPGLLGVGSVSKRTVS